MLVKCNGCQKEFECTTRKYNFNNKNNLNIYCSNECYIEIKKKESSILTSCANCGKEIRKPNAQIKRSLTGNLYCSRSCSAAKNNSIFKKWENSPKYKNGINGYRKRKLASVETPKCEKCGFCNILALDVHHKDGNRKNNTIDNLEILCCNCHAIEHRNSENVV